MVLYSPDRENTQTMPAHDAIPFSHPTLFGADPTPHLIAWEMEGEEIRAFARQGESVTSALRPFTPFLLLTDPDLLTGWKGECNIEVLSGEAPLKYLAMFHRWRDLLKARDYIQKRSKKTASAPDAPYLFLNDPVHQYLLLSGQTHFLDLPFAALHRLQLDIETYCTPGFEFSRAAREGDRIIAMAMCDSRGWETVLKGTEADEAGMLVEMVRLIRERDPDVIEGHNLFRFDLEYIEARAARYRVPLTLGRDGSVLQGHPSRMQIGERAITYRKYEIFGRHIVDTWILAQHYDIVAREFDSYGLKDIARHFGLASAERTYVLPDRISATFDHDPETLYRYALDDVRETRAVSDLLSRSYYIQAQIFPFSYQNVILRGNATKIDALLLREYLRQRSAVALPQPGQPIEGGYTELGYQGVVHHVLHCDITSLYPSLMLAQDLFPTSDTLRIFPALLRDLREFRVQAKEKSRAARDPEERTFYDALQSTFKILINSFYGYLGFSQGHFNDYATANRITAEGRALINKIKRWLEARECLIVELDTDGIYFVPPESVRTREAEEVFLHELAATLPEGIHLELDGRYPTMFSYKMKNYALLDDAGRLIVKGSGLKSRGLEPYLRNWMKEMFHLVLTGKGEKVKGLVERYQADLSAHRIPLTELAKTETLQDSLETYREKVRARKRNPAAPYELALTAERSYQPGDQISYYVTGEGRKVKAHESCKLIAQWDPAHPDENVEYYQAKLLELYEKFRPLIEGRGSVEDRTPEGTLFDE